MDQIEKFLRKIDRSTAFKIVEILENIHSLNIKGYDLEKMKSKESLYRIRSGKIRVIFCKKEGGGVPICVEFRGRVYKRF